MRLLRILHARQLLWRAHLASRQLARLERQRAALLLEGARLLTDAKVLLSRA